MPLLTSGSPWKALLLAILAGGLCFALAVGGLVYWVFFAVQKGKTNPAEVELRDATARRPAKTLAQKLGELGLGDPVPGEYLQPQTRPPAADEGVAGQAAGFGRKGRNGRVPAGEDIFKDAFVPHLEIDIPIQAKVRLMASPRTYVRATIREGDRVYKDVAIRLKGGPGSFQPLHQTPSFTINFDNYSPGQTFHGLKKIHLNSSVQDSTRLNEKICRELFDAAGVPVPRAGHAIVTLGGRDARLYVLLEGINKQFLKRYFNDPDGNVYDGHSQTDVTHALPINSGEKDRSRLQDLAEAAREPNLETRLERLEQTLDLDRFLTFMALEMMLTHWDGYTMHRNNFRIAHDRDADRMVFVPHGMDQMFGSPRQSLLSPAPAGLVARAVLEIPEVRERYRDRVAELTTNVFRYEAITNRIWAVAQRIVGALEEVDSRRAREYWERTVPEVCRKIQHRAAYLAREIDPAALPATLEFDEGAAAALKNWSSKLDLGQARLIEEKDGNGNVVLYIGTTTGCTASWRTSVILQRGRYQLEARMKTKDVEFDPGDLRAGAGLRISRHRLGQKNAGGSDWTRVDFEFEVERDREEKELVCELRARRGEIWYDLKSLRLRRLQ